MVIKISSKIKRNCFNKKKNKVLEKKCNYNFFKFLHYYFNFKVFKKIKESKVVLLRVLKYFFGLNIKLYKNLLNVLGYNFKTYLFNLSYKEIFYYFKRILEKFFLEDKIFFYIKYHFQLLLKVGNYKGKRIKQKLPLYGQRTRTNSRTCKKFLHRVIFKQIGKNYGIDDKKLLLK